MKTDFEILDEYLQTDIYHNKLSNEEQLLDKMIVRDSFAFQRYLLSVRIKEFIKMLFNH